MDYENSSISGYLKIQGLTEVGLLGFVYYTPLFSIVSLHFPRFTTSSSLSRTCTCMCPHLPSLSYVPPSSLPPTLSPASPSSLHPRPPSMSHQDYPTLTTFFEGEIISRRHPFLTRKWDASEEVDRKHWGKFAPFRPFMKTFNSDDFSYDQLQDTDFVFMRWKVS